MDADGTTTHAAEEPAPATQAAAAPPAVETAAKPHDDEVDASKLPKVRLWTVLLALLIAAAAFVLLHRLAMGPRRERESELDSAAATYDARPSVDVVKPERAANVFDLQLPADVASMQATAVFARTNGYLREFSADVGDHVAAGKTLARIDTPEVDAEIVQAQAAAGLARANTARLRVDLQLAEATLNRYAGFGESGGVTAQQLDEKRSAVEQAKAALGAAEASVVVADAQVAQLATLQSFENVTAPFDGVITARNFDVGALIGPSGPSAAKELFRVEQVDVLRVYVNVPQPYAESASTGSKAFLTVRNWPGREFAGTVTRTAGVLDPTTRTLRCEIDVPNADGALLAGMYGEIRLPVKLDRPPLLVPTSATTFGAAGPTIWVVADNRVHAKKVALGRDFGARIEVLEGIGQDDLVVKNPGERLVDGAELRVASKSTAAAPAPGSKGEAKH